MLKKPKFDLTKLMELYQERPEDVKGKTLEKGDAPKNLLAGQGAPGGAPAGSAPAKDAPAPKK